MSSIAFHVMYKVGSILASRSVSPAVAQRFHGRCKAGLAFPRLGYQLPDSRDQTAATRLHSGLSPFCGRGRGAFDPGSIQHSGQTMFDKYLSRRIDRLHAALAAARTARRRRALRRRLRRAERMIPNG